jgi:non-ribosomal peptide synthetase-like protein
MTTSAFQPPIGDRPPRPAPRPAADEKRVRHVKLVQSVPDRSADTVTLDGGAPGLRPIDRTVPQAGGEDLSAAMVVSALPIKPDGNTGELRAADAELGRLRTEVAGLLDRVRRLEQGREGTAGTRPTSSPPSPIVRPAHPRVGAPRPAPAARGPWPSANGAVPAPVQRTAPEPRPVGPPRNAPAAGRAYPPQDRRVVGGPPAASSNRPDPAHPQGYAGRPAPAAVPARRPTSAPPQAVPARRPTSAPLQALLGRPASAPAEAARCAPAAAAAATRRTPVPVRQRVETERPAALVAAPVAAPGAALDGLEAGYSAVLAEVLGIASVDATSNFFDDLGADSLLMARFCARVRSNPDLPNVTIKDVYRAPTIAALAAAGAGTPAAPAGPGAPGAPAGLGASASSGAVGAAGTRTTTSPARSELVPVSPGRASGQVVGNAARAAVGTFRYLLCGFLQLIVLLGYPALVSYAFAVGAQWVLTAATPLDIYVRSVQVVGGLFLGTALLPVLAKWLLVGRWKPTQFPVWSLHYFRFWLVKTLIRTNPLVRFVGTPLYPLYLRLLGARIGRGTTILSPTVPVCTDLVTIGAGTIVRKNSSFTGYRVYAGMVQTGRVRIGSGALVGEATVLDIGSTVGDDAQLGHTSALHTGQSVPSGATWHGSPAEPTSVNYRAVPFERGGRLRKLSYTIVQLVMLFGVVLPVGIGGLALLVREVPQVQQLLVDVEAGVEQTPLLLDVAILASALLIGGMVLGLLVMATVPRLLALLVRPDRTYRLYGVAYWAARTVTRLTNSAFATRVTGDSSYIVGFLRTIGYRFYKVEQTGSNFGTAVVHDTPFLCHVGSGTVVADGLTFVNADYSSTSFKVSRVQLGSHSFLGNAIFYPARSRVGDDCLLGTKVQVPISGPVRQGVGLLGSPSFEIPRSVDRDAKLAVTPEQRRLGVKAKNRHNLLSIALLLLSRWVYLALVVLLLRIGLQLHSQHGAVVIAALGAAELLLTFGYFAALDGTVRWLAALRPNGVSIYDRAFWRHERYWKVAADTYLQLLNGTPFKAGIWKVLGVKVGRRLFDDGCLVTERVFLTIGDHCTLNERTVIQCHSQENDAFKSDRVVIGSGVTVGVGGFVHYGTRLGDGSVLEADSFLLKGEEMAPNTRWGGNPASEWGMAPSVNNTSWRNS